MPRRGIGVSVAGAMAAIVVLAVLLRVLIVPAGRFYEWRRVDREIRTILDSIQPVASPGVPAAIWNCAEVWVGTAYSNICFSPEHVTTFEMYRLRDDLKARLVGPADLETLQWIWMRLGETGPHGREYSRRFMPMFRECFPPGEEKKSDAMGFVDLHNKTYGILINADLSHPLAQRGSRHELCA